MSESQTNANRENAQKSTGPTTDAGKATSSHNATTHGFTSKSTNPFHPGEDPQEFLALRENHYTIFQPVGLAEEKLVDRITADQWRLGRIFSHEAAIHRDYFYNIEVIDRYRGSNYEKRKEYAIADKEPIPERPEVPGPEDLAGRAFVMDCKGPNALIKLVRYETSLERSLERTIRLLNTYQTTRRDQEAHQAAQQAAEENARKAAERAATPSDSVDCKTKPKFHPNPPAEAPAEPLETVRSSSSDPALRKIPPQIT